MKRLLLLLLCLAGTAIAAAPEVTDVLIVQQTNGSGIVDITYMLDDADGDTCAVAVQASEDGGLTWHLPCTHLSGDVGPGVTPGGIRRIQWDLAADNPGATGEDFRVRVLASDAGVEHVSHSPMNYTTLHFGSDDFNNQTLIEELARYDLVGVTADEIWRDAAESARFIERVKAINPDIKIVGYSSVKTVHQGWAHAPAGSYARAMWDGLLPYWSYTTTGDTLMDWPGVINVNILDQACRDVFIDTFVAWQQTAANRLDGIYWDYFNNGIWIPDFVSCEGDPDMDGNGISQYSDPAEIEAYRQACVEMTLGLRSKLGDDFIQIFNGQRAYTDSLFASHADGVIYELFPTLGFQGGQRVRDALDPAVPHSLPNMARWLRDTAGGPYILLENHNQYRYYDHEGEIQDLVTGDHFRVISLLLDGVYPVWNAEGLLDQLWPTAVFDLGEPLGPLTVNGDVYTRSFRYGEIVVEMDNGDWPDPFNYEVRVNGSVVQAFDRPYHFP